MGIQAKSITQVLARLNSITPEQGEKEADWLLLDAVILLGGASGHEVVQAYIEAKRKVQVH